jgi:hypothetical protein
MAIMPLKHTRAIANFREITRMLLFQLPNYFGISDHAKFEIGSLDGKLSRKQFYRFYFIFVFGFVKKHARQFGVQAVAGGL